MVVKSFRGVLADQGQERIHLSTNQGKVGYRIVKFEVFPFDPANFTQESLVQIFKNEIATVPAATNAQTDFSNPDLLAAALYTSDASGGIYPEDTIIVFDLEIFNQDIYVTHTDQSAGAKINYYIELEVIPLTDTGAEYTTLKDLRDNA